MSEEKIYYFKTEDGRYGSSTIGVPAHCEEITKKEFHKVIPEDELEQVNRVLEEEN